MWRFTPLTTACKAMDNNHRTLLERSCQQLGSRAYISWQMWRRTGHLSYPWSSCSASSHWSWSFRLVCTQGTHNDGDLFNREVLWSIVFHTVEYERFIDKLTLSVEMINYTTTQSSVNYDQYRPILYPLFKSTFFITYHLEQLFCIRIIMYSLTIMNII